MSEGGLMTDGALLSLLHLCDTLFPVGAYAYSEGLETAAADREVAGADDLRAWIDVCLDDAIGRCDGPAVAGAWSAVAQGRWDSLAHLDDEVCAIRPAAAARQASRAMGRRLLATWQAVHPDARVAHALALTQAGVLRPAWPIAFACAAVAAGVDQRAALEGFAYTRLAATVSAAMRLIAIGQTEAHAVLAGVLARVPAVADRVLAGPGVVESFAPAMDISMMNQQYVHSRLFRS